ncbi:MAG: YcaQ family DNA glycosylase [Chloroflexi bacterium]|nr:YcaQ family DNA glycosylase [Chloroflexota bacterium]
MIELSQDEARLLFLRAQGFIGRPDRKAGAGGVLRAVGAVQLDTISALARTHELIPYARLGPIPRKDVEDAYWHRPARAFEYWAHAMCIIPIEDWPWYWARRRKRAAYTHPRRPHDKQAIREALALLKDGPITSEDIGGSRSKAPAIKNVWWHWSPLKIAVEHLLSVGEVVCVERRGWRRVYDLAERAIPARLLKRVPSDEECHDHLVREALVRQGVATATDLQTYFGGMYMKDARAAAIRLGLMEARVHGWKDRAWVDRDALKSLKKRGAHRTTLLSPFDSLVWERDRDRRFFDFAFRLEAYTPAHLREHGYFVMPLLAGGRLVGRVDPGRAGTTLIAKRVSFETGAVEEMAGALVETASWVGCDAVRVEKVVPAKHAGSLRAAIKRVG